MKKNRTDKGFEREIFDRFTTIHQKKYIHYYFQFMYQ